MSPACYSPTSLRIILLALLLLTANSCSLTKGKGAAEAAVKRFHEQYNSGHYSEIYKETDQQFKDATTESELVTLLEAVQKKLGPVKNAKQTGWGVNTTTMGTVAKLGYDVEFAEGKGTEEFVYHINGNNAALVHYNVNSPLLITKE